MGNVIDSFFTGFSDSIQEAFKSTIDFFTGTSCETKCPSPLYVICNIENFCVGNLVRFILIMFISCCFLFFFKLLYKIGFFECIVYGFCRLMWGLCSYSFYVLDRCCSFVFYDVLRTKRRRRRRHRGYREDEYDYDYGDSDSDDGWFRHKRPRREGRKEEHIRKSLRPRSHRVSVGVRKDHRAHVDGAGSVHGIKVSRESKFARKGTKGRTRVHHGPRKA